jgi:hypothetical protein
MPKLISVPPTVEHADAVAAFNDPIWATLATATPAQIDTYLTNNVTTLAQARVVLRIFALALRYIIKHQKQAGA